MHLDEKIIYEMALEEHIMHLKVASVLHMYVQRIYIKEN